MYGDDGWRFKFHRPRVWLDWEDVGCCVSRLWKTCSLPWELLKLTRRLNFFFSLHAIRLTLPDLTPNPGLWWYFFTEMFDHFRPFFLMVFSVSLRSQVPP